MSRCLYHSAVLFLLCFLAVALSPSYAFAHAQIPGLSDFFNGALHPLSVPSHLLLLIALGLLLGQHLPLNLKPPIAAFAIFSAAGLVSATAVGTATSGQALLLCLAMYTAMFVALQRRIAILWRVLLCAAAAFAIGFDSGLEPGTHANAAKMLAGIWCCLLLAVTDIAIYASLCKRQWMQIGLRIFGSWIIAIALLVLAFALKGNAAARAADGDKLENVSAVRQSPEARTATR